MNKNRVVFDTNVYISAIIFDGSLSELLRMAISRKYQVFISDDIIVELSNILKVKFKFEDQEITNAIKQVELIATLNEVKQKLSVIKNNPQDNKILACALCSKADYLVTGDKKHLLPIKEYRGTSIVSPNDFIAIMKQKN